MGDKTPMGSFSHVKDRGKFDKKPEKSPKKTRVDKKELEDNNIKIDPNTGIPINPEGNFGEGKPTHFASRYTKKVKKITK